MQRCGEFRDSKEDKKSEAHPAKPEKAKPGAFWVVEGMRTVGNSKNQARKPGAECIPFPYNSCKKETGENPVFPPVLRQGQKDLVTPAAPGAAPQWEAPSTSRGGSRDRRGRAPLALAHLSASGFGVDVGTAYREWGSAGVGRFRPKSERGRVVVAGPPSAPTIRVFCQSRRDMPGVRK